MENQNSLNKRIENIEFRNKQVEANKAWETSKTRTLFIFVVTYIIALVWLLFIKEVNAFLKALVPAIGWYLSTLSLPFIKKRWIRKYSK